MKKMAARDFEDIMQCIIPPLEGLFPKFNKILLDLWFDMAHWHCLAKLRMHSSSTVTLLKEQTSELGRTTRQFAKDTEDIDTYETPREERIRQKRDGKAAEGGRKRKRLNIETPKFHAVGYYYWLVTRVGTTDSVSTQIVSLAFTF
ncbi:hypothetical protein GGX14DRAFT_380879 [Mycena pura]|uniref:Uncharacterized protein n=1 Tax=Mycena pura TaxID=153505 RepID=A0AAD6Y4Y8_9AGAR|nr:hypothetical protein GGX14DRAFT_380879 [Mycena pura]